MFQDKYWKKNRILISIIFSPILIWLLIFPSTDIIFSLLILIAISCILKVYKIFNKNLNYQGSLKKINFIFIFSIFLALLCRPLILIIIPLLTFYFLILWSLNFNSKKRNSDNINLINFLYSKYFIYLLSFSLLFVFSSSNIYSNYSPNHFPNNEFKMHGLIFDTYSPPAPEGLKEITHGSFSKLISYFILNIKNLRFEILPLLKQLIVFMLSIFQSLIFSLLSLAGLQTTVFSEENLNIIRYTFSTYKIIFGLFINLPGIFMFFVIGLNSLKILLKEPIYFLTNKENIFRILVIISMFYCIGLLITIGHIRYLLPILPILIISSKKF